MRVSSASSRGSDSATCSWHVKAGSLARALRRTARTPRRTRRLPIAARGGVAARARDRGAVVRCWPGRRLATAERAGRVPRLHVRRSGRRALRARRRAPRGGHPGHRQPARGALFYLEGGPGGAATAAAVAVDAVFAKVSEFRDIVLRGSTRHGRLAGRWPARRSTSGRRTPALSRRTCDAASRAWAPGTSIHDRDRRGAISNVFGGGSAMAGSTSTAALTARRSPRRICAASPARCARDARRSIAREHARVRARGPQCGARVADADRPLPRAAGLPAGLYRHPSGARPCAGAAPARVRRPRHGGRGAAALTRGRRARAPARARGGRGRRSAAGPRIRNPRRARSSTLALACRCSG